MQFCHNKATNCGDNEYTHENHESQKHKYSLLLLLVHDAAGCLEPIPGFSVFVSICYTSNNGSLKVVPKIIGCIFIRFMMCDIIVEYAFNSLKNKLLFVIRQHKCCIRIKKFPNLIYTNRALYVFVKYIAIGSFERIFCVQIYGNRSQSIIQIMNNTAHDILEIVIVHCHSNDHNYSPFDIRSSIRFCLKSIQNCICSSEIP